MLPFAIATFFVVALIGALLVIGAMLSEYRLKIIEVVLEGLVREAKGQAAVSQPVLVMWKKVLELPYRLLTDRLNRRVSMSLHRPAWRMLD